MCIQIILWQVRFGETTVKKLSMGFRDVKEKPCHSLSACVSLALLKVASPTLKGSYPVDCRTIVVTI